MLLKRSILFWEVNASVLMAVILSFSNASKSIIRLNYCVYYLLWVTSSLRI